MLILNRDENLPLFLPKFAEINCVWFDPTCSNLMHFERGRGGFIFLDWISCFLENFCSHPLLKLVNSYFTMNALNVENVQKFAHFSIQTF